MGDLITEATGCSHIGCNITKTVGAWRCAGCGESLSEHPAKTFASLRAEVEYYREREEHFAKALGVADGGQYRADWDGAIRRVLAVLDEARASLARVTEERDQIRRAMWEEERLRHEENREHLATEARLREEGAAREARGFAAGVEAAARVYESQAHPRKEMSAAIRALRPSSAPTAPIPKEDAPRDRCREMHLGRPCVRERSHSGEHQFLFEPKEDAPTGVSYEEAARALVAKGWKASPEDARCKTLCDHGSRCSLPVDHVPSDRHETEHGCICYDPRSPASDAAPRCGPCGGTGRVWFEGASRPCDDCGGTGRSPDTTGGQP